MLVTQYLYCMCVEHVSALVQQMFVCLYEICCTLGLSYIWKISSKQTKNRQHCCMLRITSNFILVGTNYTCNTILQTIEKNKKEIKKDWITGIKYSE